MQRDGPNVELTRTFVAAAVEELEKFKPKQFKAHYSIDDGTVDRWKGEFAKDKVPRAKAGMVARFLKIKELAPEQFAFSDDACKAINAFLGLMQEENPSGKRLQRVWMVRLIALAVALMIVPIVGVIAIVARQSSDRVQAAPVAVIEDDDNRYEKLTSLLRSNTFLCYNPSRLKISGVASTNGGADGMAL